jgi:Flp pilus assembly protein TadD
MMKKNLVLACLVAVLVAGLAPGQAAAKSPAEQQIAFGVDMARRGLWREALFRFLEAERLEPGNPRVLSNIAVAQEAVGDFEKALEYYQKAVKADPASREIKTNYARFAEFYQSFKGQEAAAKPSAGEDTPPPATDEEPPGRRSL